MLYFAILLFILGLALLLLVRRRQKASGLPAGRIIYTDTRGWNAVKESLYDPIWGLAGKPDYLVEKNGRIIPVEVKSGRAPEAPYDSHIYQLAAYCRLAEVKFNQRPAYGILHYSNRTYAIDYTPELEAAVLQALADMRACDSRREVDRSHNSSGRCRGCGYQAVCSQKLN